jgi:hypothetical protein
MLSLALAVGGAWAGEAGAPWRMAGEWQAIAPGLELARVELTPSRDPLLPGAVLVRIEPARARFDVRHYRAEGPSGPLTPREWQQRTGAAVVINAGQFDPDLRHLGYLVSKGRNLGSAGHATFKGLFVAQPATAGPPPARILDLQWDSFDVERTPYACVLQSFMLLDRKGRTRVRNSGKLAERSLILEDAAGRIILLTTEGRQTLWDLARAAAACDLKIVQGMSLDGGRYAQLIVESAEVRYDSAAARARGSGGAPALVPAEARLPAVLVVYPRAAAEQHSAPSRPRPAPPSRSAPAEQDAGSTP